MGRTEVRALATACVIAALGSHSACSGNKDSRRESLIVICVDTLRADHVGTYGYWRNTTPRIDALAREGVLFESAIAPSPWTIPSVAGLLTSRYPSEHGAVVPGEMKDLKTSPPRKMYEGVATLPEILRDHGFRTGLFSANPLLKDGGFDRGFDAANVRWRHAEALFRDALEWIEEAPETSFFVYLQPIDLHQPVRPPEPFFSLFPAAAGGDRTEKHSSWSYGRLESVADPEFHRFRDHKVSVYDGALRYVDRSIGEFLDELRALDLFDRCVIVVTSDHGEEFWDHVNDPTQRERDPRGLSGIGHGHTLYQELLRVPFIARIPEASARPVARLPVSLIDLVPTVLARWDIRAELPLRGENLEAALPSPLVELEDPALRVRPARSLIAESPAYGPDARCVLRRGLKLIAIGGKPSYLFDLGQDPGERVNLIAERPEDAQELANLLDAQLGRDERSEQPAAPMSASQRDALESLGYLD